MKKKGGERGWRAEGEEQRNGKEVILRRKGGGMRTRKLERRREIYF